MPASECNGLNYLEMEISYGDDTSGSQSGCLKLKRFGHPIYNYYSRTIGLNYILLLMLTMYIIMYTNYIYLIIIIDISVKGGTRNPSLASPFFYATHRVSRHGA
jgi:hypothetical protein